MFDHTRINTRTARSCINQPLCAEWLWYRNLGGSQRGMTCCADSKLNVEKWALGIYLAGEVRHGSTRREIKWTCSIMLTCLMRKGSRLNFS